MDVSEDAASVYAARDRRGGTPQTLPGELMHLFFGLTVNSTLYVVTIHLVFYVFYATMWALVLGIDVVHQTLMENNFNGAFSYVIWLMQGVYLKDIFDIGSMGATFFSLVLETRTIAFMLSAYLRGSQCTRTGWPAKRAPLPEGVAEVAHHVRGMLHVYTRCHFELFGVPDTTNDYKKFKFADEDACARRIFAGVSMADEATTAVLDGATYELLASLASLRKAKILSTEIYAKLIDKIDEVNTTKNRILQGRRPLISPLLDMIPNASLLLYVYVLIPLGVYSSVSRFWGIFIYSIILLIYNARNVIAHWLGTPFSPFARYRPLSFEKLRNQCFVMVELLLGTLPIGELRDDLEGTTLSSYTAIMRQVTVK